jgi:hypothetical protein
VLLLAASHEPAGPGTALARASSAGSAGELARSHGVGEVLVAGARAGAGAHARRGASIETRGATGVFDVPGRVHWTLEDESRVEVESAGAPVVLALSRGALEAEVAPVASGEAFAVDVEGVRVAVHGTHLRVARLGDQVVVDLSEGVVSIGVPPKIGSTYGALVMAPAHIEFQAGSLGTSLKVDHLAAAVREPIDLRASDEGAPASAPAPSAPSAPRDAPVAPVRAHVAAPHSPAHAAQAIGNPRAEEDIVAAVHACAAAQPRSSEVAVTVSSTISIKLREDGSVQLAHFDPPLAPEIQACVSRTVFATRFIDAADRKIPVSF